jgi:hypothetical protein
MPEAAKRPQSPLQQQILLMAQELATQLELTAQQAPPGSILDACESLLLDRGRQFLRDSLAATLQQQVDDSEKKGAQPAPVPVATPAATRDPVPVSS